MDGTTFIGTTATLLSVGLAIYFWRRPRRPQARLTLSVGTTSFIRTDMAGHIAILYDGNAVPRVTTVHLLLANTGRTTISDRDVRQPVGVRFREPIVLLSLTDVAASDYERIKPRVTVEGNDIHLGFDFLEAGDELWAELLTTAPSGAPIVTIGAIEGMPSGIVRADALTGHLASEWDESMVEFTTALGIPDCASIFRRTTERLSLQGELEFFTPFADSPFAAVEESTYDFIVGARWKRTRDVRERRDRLSNEVVVRVEDYVAHDAVLVIWQLDSVCGLKVAASAPRIVDSVLRAFRTADPGLVIMREEG